MSRGSALTRIVILVVAAVVLFFAIRTCFPSREERLQQFIDRSRAALADGRDEEFLAAFDPAVRYQKSGGLAEIRRDLRRYRDSGIGAPTLLKQHLTLDATGADAQLEVEFIVDMHPIAQAAVTMRLEDAGGPWRVTTLGWR